MHNTLLKSPISHKCEHLAQWNLPGNCMVSFRDIYPANSHSLLEQRKPDIEIQPGDSFRMQGECHSIADVIWLYFESGTCICICNQNSIYMRGTHTKGSCKCVPQEKVSLTPDCPLQSLKKNSASCSPYIYLHCKIQTQLNIKMSLIDSCGNSSSSPSM